MDMRCIAAFWVVVALALCSPGTACGQADPYWLKSWNNALKGRPEMLASSSRIAAADEPGTPLEIHGRVFLPDRETPAGGVVVHAYHRDRDGFDFGPGDRALDTWRLQGWAVTDADGRFEFRTVRPAPDHLGREGAHIHFTLESRELGRQWAPTVYFADDPIVSQRIRQESAKAGEFGWVLPTVERDGTQHLDVKIRLRETGDF